MKRPVVLLLLAALGLALAAAAASARSSSGVRVTIRHQVRGCHTWSVNGGAYRPSQTIHVARGTVIEVTNNDVMPHRLYEQRGPHVALHNLVAPAMGMGMHNGSYGPGMMGQMGASTETTLAKPGTYVFGTHAGEDYMPGMKTVGEDDVLRLTVVVR